MFKKYLLILLFLLCSFNACADIWGDIGGCITDPCNCGQSDRTEIWNSGNNNQVKKTFQAGDLCPPWNKSNGRGGDNCLLQFDYPGTFIGFYLSRCAEETPDSNYFNPKIRIRIQSCNAAACWSQATTLNWDGECVLWPTGYGLPLTRVCARVAVPATPGSSGLNSTPSPADPGYTEGVHLNSVGYTENDATIVGVDGQIITIESPKLCAYSDPGLVNLVSDSGAHTDAMDWNPNSQPLHYTTDLSPIAQVLQFLATTVSGGNLPNMLSQLLGMMGSENSQVIKVFQTIFQAIGDIFSIFPDLITSVIKVFGALNGAVDGYSFGCVQLPFGPFPPPFCPNLNDLSVPAILNNICSLKNSDGKIFNQSSTQPPCVVSNVRNNVINNTVRVSFNNLVPLCTGTNPDLKTCVQINNAKAFSAKNASIAHTSTAYTDFIQSCSNAPANAPCINTQIPLSCSVTANGCNQGFRLVYSQVMGTVETPSDYYISDIPDCGTAAADTSTTCQQVWGVNVGEFLDVSVQFPMVQEQDTNSLLPLQQNFTLIDNNNKARNLYASISNTTTDQQDPTKICVFESSNLAGCNPRVNTNYNLVTYECGGHAEITCPTNTYYTPQFITSMQARDDSGNIIDETNTVTTPLSYTADSSSTDMESIVTLAGYNYSSSVTFIPTIPPDDPADKYIAIPFSGTNSLNQLTIYGIYKDNAQPYDKNGNSNPNAVYLKYLEYINGKYIQGGTHACLMPKDFQHCSPIPSNPNTSNSGNVGQVNCVLATLNDANTVDCSVFKSKSSTYPNLGLCTVDTNSCTEKETLPGSGKGITIYTCGASDCYMNNDNADTPVCVLSNDYQDRLKPEANVGPILDASQYYTVEYDSNSNPTYHASTSDVRDKTWQELNLCTSITVPTCGAIPNPSNSSGNAIWSETQIGDLAEGICPLNWVVIDPSKPLQRYCLSNYDNKTVAFEPLDKNVGCRESKGLPVQITDNNFPTQLVNTPYDPTTKTGDFILNVKPIHSDHWGVMAFPNNPKTFIDASNEPGSTALYSITFEVTLDAIMSDIDYFQILDLWYDDCVLVYVNDTKVLSSPIASVDSLDNKNSCNNGNDQGEALQATNLPIDIKPYLHQGSNTITFQLRVMLGGGLYYHMQYKMLR